MLFKAWRPWCAHIKRRAVLSRIILRWQNKHLKLGFEKWLHVLNQVCWAHYTHIHNTHTHTHLSLETLNLCFLSIFSGAESAGREAKREGDATGGTQVDKECPGHCVEFMVDDCAA